MYPQNLKTGSALYCFSDTVWIVAKWQRDVYHKEEAKYENIKETNDVVFFVVMCCQAFLPTN